SPAVLACSTAVRDLIASRVPSQPIEDASGQIITVEKSGPKIRHTIAGNRGAPNAYWTTPTLASARPSDPAHWLVEAARPNSIASSSLAATRQSRTAAAFQIQCAFFIGVCCSAGL